MSSDVWKPNVPDKLDCYPMKEVGASVRGWVLVFYHEDLLHLELEGAALPHLLLHLLNSAQKSHRGFLVKAYKDLKFEIIKGVLNETARSQDLKDHDCLIVCFLSHGQDGGHLFANNVRFDEEELWRPFYGDKCKALVDKPKLFFIQACRGEVLDEGVKAMVRRAGHSRGDTHDSHQRHEEEYHLPTHANILIAHATYEEVKNMKKDERTWNNIRKNWRQLRERFNLKSDDLLKALDETDGKVFRFGEVETIKAISEPEKRFDEIFDILFAKNPNVYYDVLLNALKALDRQDILDFLESADDAPQSQTSPTGREEQQHPIGSSSDREDGVQLLAEPQSSSASVESATVSDETDARGYSIRKVISKLGGKKQDEDSSDPSRDHLWKPKIPDKLDCYKMKGSGGKDRGWAIIFCYEEFDQYLQLPPRKGVQKDVNNLTRVFKDRGFSVKTYKNLKYQSIKEELYE
ncbi:unnamed protein product, partial [Darwinula stevensoni]